jgi:hypothetical protein
MYVGPVRTRATRRLGVENLARAVESGIEVVIAALDESSTAYRGVKICAVAWSPKILSTLNALI